MAYYEVMASQIFWGDCAKQQTQACLRVQIRTRGRPDFVSVGAQMLLFVDRHLKKNNVWFENIRSSNPVWGKKCLDAPEELLVTAGVSFVTYGRPSLRMA